MLPNPSSLCDHVGWVEFALSRPGVRMSRSRSAAGTNVINLADEYFVLGKIDEAARAEIVGKDSGERSREHSRRLRV